VVLPEPDSPTRAKVSPWRVEGDTVDRFQELRCRLKHPVQHGFETSTREQISDVDKERGGHAAVSFAAAS